MQVIRNLNVKVNCGLELPTIWECDLGEVYLHVGSQIVCFSVADIGSVLDGLVTLNEEISKENDSNG